MLKSKGFSLFIFFVVTSIAVIWLYRDGLSSYFFQDDWFTFRIARVANLKDFLNFFVPRQDVIYYRPLGMQLPFFLLRSLFDLNPWPFKVLTFFVHLVNTLLVFLIAVKLVKDKIISYLTAFLYAVSGVHYIIFYWSSTISFMLGPLLFFAAFLSFITGGQKYLYLSYLFYFLGLLTNEIVVSLPLILTAYVLFLTDRKKISRLLVYYLLPLSILAVRLLLFTPPLRGNYALSLNRQTLINFRDYFFWTFNFPEEIRNQFVSFLGINRTFLKDFNGYYLKNLWSFLMTLLLLFIIPILSLIRHFGKKDLKFLIFIFIWYLAALIAVILFSNHTFTYYLPIALTGLLIGASFLLSNLRGQYFKKNKFLFYLYLFTVAIFWFMGSLTLVNFNDKVHWAPRRARIARKLVQKAAGFDLNAIQPVIYIRDDPEYKFALNDQDGLKVFFNREEIITRYLKESSLEIRL